MPEPKRIAVLLGQREFYSSEFTVDEIAEHYGCEPTVEACIAAVEQSISDGDIPDWINDAVLNHWDMADDSDYSVQEA